MSIRNLAWAAGLFEGEGSIGYYPLKSKWRKNSVKVSVNVNSTDEDVLRDFMEVVGLGKIRGPSIQSKHPDRKPYWSWEVQTQSGVLEFLNLVLPYLGKRRTEKALSVIDSLNKRKQTDA